MVKKLKIFLIVILYMSFFSRAFSQVQYGFRVGANLSKLNLEYDNEYELSETMKPGLNMAVLLNFSLGKSLTFQVEPGYSQFGTKYEQIMTTSLNGSPYQEIDRGKIYLSYIELPILLQYRYGIGKLGIIASLGPQVRLLTKPLTTQYTITAFVDGISDGDDKYYEGLGGKDGIKKWDCGLTGGIGIEAPLKSLKLFGDIRYNQGIKNITAPYDSEGRAVNTSLSVNFGILMPLK